MLGGGRRRGEEEMKLKRISLEDPASKQWELKREKKIKIEGRKLSKTNHTGILLS